MSINKELYIFTSAMLLSGAVFAQKSLSEQINIVKEYKPQIEYSEKILSNPEIEDSKPFRPIFNWNYQPVLYDTLHTDRKLSPEKMGKESLPKLYPHRVSIGGGNYGGFLTEYFVSNNRNVSSNLNAHLKHLSHSPGGQLTNLDRSLNLIEGNWRKRFNEGTYQTFLEYQRDGYNYYGLNEGNERFNKRKFLNSIGWNQHYQQSFLGDSTKTTVLPYSFIGYFSDNAKANETSILLGVQLSDNTSGVPLEGLLEVDLNNIINNAGFEINNHLFNSKFVYHYSDTNWKVQLGFKTVSEFGSFSAFHFFPHLTADYLFTGDVVRVFGGLTGNTRKNNLRILLTENNFLSENILIRNTTENIHLFVGLRANFDGLFGLSTRLSYLITENMPFYYEDNTMPRSFSVRYDLVKGRWFKWSNQLDFFLGEKLKMNLEYTVNNYESAAISTQFYLPYQQATFEMLYNLGNKIFIGSTIEMVGTRYYLSTRNTISSLDGYSDWSIHFDYKYSKMLGGFLKVNNLIGKRYELYHNYAVFGLNMMAGLNISF